MNSAIGLPVVSKGSRWRVRRGYYEAGYELEVMRVVRTRWRRRYVEVLIGHPRWHRRHWQLKTLPLDERWGHGLVCVER